MRYSGLRTVAGVATASLLLVMSALAQTSVRDLFEQARLLDDSNQNLREAIRLYTQVVAQAGDQRALAARAQYRVGVLYERLGRKEEGRRAFQAVVDQYPDQTDLARKARSKIDADRRSDRAEPPVIRQTGPSADGSYLETFTLSTDANLLLAIDPARRRLYLVTSRYTNDAVPPSRRTLYEQSWLIVIDTDRNVVIRTLPLGIYIEDVTFNAANNKLYAAAQVDGRVTVIDAGTLSRSDIAVPGYPTGIAANPITNKVYVTSQGFGGHDKLFVIDGNSAAVTGPYELDGVAGEVSVNPTTNRVYAFAPPKTRVFDGADLSIVTDLSGVGIAHADPFGNRLYARSEAWDGVETLQVIDGNTHSVTASFASSSPFLTLDHNVDRLYVILSQKDQMAVINTDSRVELGRLLLPSAPQSVVADPSTGHLYVCHRGQTAMIGVLPLRNLQSELVEEFSDEFASSTLDSSWTAVTGPGSYSLTEKQDHLRIREAKGDGPNPRSLVVRRFRGDQWVLDLKTSYVTGPSGGGRSLFFGIHLGLGPMASVARESSNPKKTNFVQISRFRDDWNGCCEGKMTVFFWERGKVAASSVLPSTQPDAYQWRIKRHGRTITVERSTDGTAFALVGAHTYGTHIDGLIESLVIGLNSFAGNEAYADYDYVRLTKTPMITHK